VSNQNDDDGEGL